MASPFVLQNEFLGMWRDNSRDMLPAGKLWNSVNLIPDYLGAPLAKRYGTVALSTQLGSCNDIQGLISSDAGSNGANNYALGSDNNFYSFSSSSNTSIGAAFAVSQNPVLHRTGTTPLIVIPAASGSTTAKSYDGSTFQTLAGSPPQGIYADVWNDHCLLANATANPQRLWFGPVGNAAGTWDTTNSWLDTKTAIVGVAAIRTGIMLFHTRTTDMVSGTTAPSATSIGDLSLRYPAFDVGCIDARTIVKYNDTVLWADGMGIYQSDGNTVKDLTAAGGMKSYWQNVTSQLPGPNKVVGPINTVVAAGIYRDTYFISVTGSQAGVRVEIDTLAYDIVRGIWFRVSGFGASAYCRQAATSSEETLMGVPNFGLIGPTYGFVSGLSGITNAHSSQQFDASGANIIPLYETGFFRGWQHWHRKWVPSMALQSWRRVYLNYQLADPGTTPQITISYATQMNGSYTDISPVLKPNTAYQRIHRDIHIQGNGIMFKVAQTNSSTATLFNSLEVEYSPLETSRLAQ